MAQQQQQGGGSSDNSMAPVWIMVLLLFTLYFVWLYAHEYIVIAVFQLNLIQAKFFNFFLNKPELANIIYIMETVDPKRVNWSQLVQLSRTSGQFTIYPVMATLIILGILLYFSNLKLKFRKSHDMKSLRAQEQHNWPAIMPVIKQDLVAEDISKGPWAMALSPMEFARKHNLLKKDDALMDNALPGQEMTAGVKKGDAKRVFTLQLGPYWDGFERCTPATQALIAIFIARINRDRDAATLIVTTLNKTFTEGKPNYAIAKPILKKYKDSELVREIIPKHAYVLSMMASLLAAARNDGVVATSDFLWLKVVDRRLWYMLNSVGRQTPFAEVAGPFAHWLAEKAMSRRSLVPMVEEAIKALEIAIKEVKLNPRELKELEP